MDFYTNQLNSNVRMVFDEGKFLINFKFSMGKTSSSYCEDGSVVRGADYKPKGPWFEALA